MRKLLIALCLWTLPLSAQNLDKAIPELIKEPKGQIVTPQTTDELKELFKDATLTEVPRIFVDKLPADFAQNGSPELYTQIITALILRENEQALKEKMLLTVLKNKYDSGKEWSKTETDFFHMLVEKYDVTVTKTTATKLTQLQLKVDEVIPTLAVAQSVYATDWGKKNMTHPYGQMGWLDEENYNELPYDSLIEATKAYVKEMNSAANYWEWRTHRQKSSHRYIKENLGYTLAASIQVYRPEDPLYKDTIRKIIINNPPLKTLYNATFINKGE